MSIAYWCILLAIVLAYLPLGVAKFGRTSGYDNARPRQTEAEMTGFRARALGAHNNGLEAFTLFAVAVLVANQVGKSGDRLNLMAVAWIALRSAYVVSYVAGGAFIRSLVWGASFALALAILTLPAWG